MKRVGIFLVTVALIAGMAGCVQPVPFYDLTIASTAGGSVTTPGEGTFTYVKGEVVNLVATPDAGFRFVNWTGSAGSIADVYAASTNITMNGDYSIIANFEAIPPVQYNLTIASTAGGNVTTPGEGTFGYDVNTVVNLVAEAEEGYKFLNWTGDIDTVADVNVASTTITMNDDCAITANFVQASIYLDKIGPGLWTLFVVGEGVEAVVTDYGIVVNIASDPVGDPEAGEFMAGGLYTLQGDFDIRMGYELTVWPEGSGVRVGLSAGIGSGMPNNKGVNVERVGLHVSEWLGRTGREVYLVHCNEGIGGITDIDDLSGTLRIRREGETVTGYYGTSDGWQELYRAEWPTENVGIRLAVWSREYLFGGEEVSVLLRTAEMVELAP